MTAVAQGLQIDDPLATRQAGRELLSLLLIDARNHLLQRLALDESPAALRLAASAGHYQAQWIGCHVQRIEPPTPELLRAYLAQTLDITLDLLASATESDEALHFYRQSLLHEDRLCETLDESLRTGMPPARVVRDALWMPAQRWQLGSIRGGLVPALERWAHEVSTPEFEIDAQPVNWAQFVEFADDGGYDRRELWGDDGWAWVQATGRRAPAFVEQLRGGVLVQRGQSKGLQRAAAGQPVMHLTRHEAMAWCQWAGRRLPTEPEWEIAACTAASRGFVWGDVFEWVAGSARTWPGADAPAPGAIDSAPIAPTPAVGVLRGGSFATRARWRYPKARRFVRVDTDTPFCGFRSCAF